MVHDLYGPDFMFMKLHPNFNKKEFIVRYYYNYIFFPFNYFYLYNFNLSKIHLRNIIENIFFLFLTLI